MCPIKKPRTDGWPVIRDNTHTHTHCFLIQNDRPPYFFNRLKKNPDLIWCVSFRDMPENVKQMLHFSQFQTYLPITTPNLLRCLQKDEKARGYCIESVFLWNTRYSLFQHCAFSACICALLIVIQSNNIDNKNNCNGDKVFKN